MIYDLRFTCPYCGGQCEHVTNGATTTWETRSLVRCLECEAEVIVVVHLVATVDNHQPQKRTPIVHGTRAGYQAHRRRGEHPCIPCTEAHNEVTREARRRMRERRKEALA